MSKLTKFKVRRSQFPLDFRIVDTTRDTNIKTLTAMPGTVFEEGTEETAEIYNGLQLGLVHSVIPVKSVANSIDYYTCDIEGIVDFGMHNELKLQMKITATNEYDQPKIKMAGNDYQIMRFDGVQLTQVLAGQLKTDNIYNLSFNGTLFILSSGMIAEKEVKALLDTTDFQATETTNGISKIATQAEVNLGIDDTKIVTAKKLRNNIATETVSGISKIATQAEVNLGVDDAKIVTANKLKNIPKLLTQNGYIKRSDGMIEQWGTGTTKGSDGINGTLLTYPISFPNACLTITAIDYGYGCTVLAINTSNNSQFRVWAKSMSTNNFSDTIFSWRAIGY